MSDREEIRDRIRTYLLQEFLPGEDPANLKDDMPLTRSGILDSISKLNLVKFVEETYEISVEANEASFEFDRIEDIVALIEGKQ